MIVLFRLATLLAGTFWGYVTVGAVIIVSIIGFIIGWKVSDFFIAPRDYWTKSGAVMLTTKLGIAVMGGYFAVTGFAYLISWLFG